MEVLETDMFYLMIRFEGLQPDSIRGMPHSQRRRFVDERWSMEDRDKKKGSR